MRSKLPKPPRRSPTSDSLLVRSRGVKRGKPFVLYASGHGELSPSTPTTFRPEFPQNARVATRSRRPPHTIPLSHAGAVFDLRKKYTNRRSWPRKLRIAHKGKKFDFVRVPVDAEEYPEVKYRYQYAPGRANFTPYKAKVSFDVMNDRPGNRVVKLDYLYFEKPRDAKSDPSGPAVIEAVKSIADKVILDDHSYAPDPSRPAGSTIPRYLSNLPNLYAGFDRDPRENPHHQEQRRVLTALRRPIRTTLTTSGGKVRMAMHATAIPSAEDVQHAFDNQKLVDRIIGNEKLTKYDYRPNLPERTWQRPKVKVKAVRRFLEIDHRGARSSSRN